MKNLFSLDRRLTVATTVLLFLAGLSARGTVYDWTNTSGGNWSNTNNWSPNQIPGAGDTANITVAASYGVTLDVKATVAGLILGASSAGTTQSLNTGGQTLTVNGPIQVNSQGQLNLNGGALAGTIGLQGTLTWSGGSLAGVLTLASNSVLNIVAGGGDGFTGLVLTNYGTVNWTNTTLEGINDANAEIYNYGLWNAQSDNTFYGGTGGGDCVFNNFGTFLKSGGTNVTTLDNHVIFNNTGTVSVASGTLDIVGGGTSSDGEMATTNGGVINFSSYNFKGSNVFSGVGSFVAGGAAFSGTVEGTLGWDGGSLSGVLTLTSNSVLNIVAGGGNGLTGLVLTNYGTVNWTNTTLEGINDANAEIYNYGLWNAQSDNTFYGGTGGGTTLFENFGTFLKSGGTNVTTLDDRVVFNSSGNLDFQSGTLSLNGNYNISGGDINFGINSQSSYGAISLSGAEVLSGISATVSFNNGFVPATGSQFQLLSCSSLTGTFLTGNLDYGVSFVYSKTNASLMWSGIDQADWAAGDSALHGTNTITLLVMAGTSVQLVASAGGVSTVLGATTASGTTAVTFDTTQLRNGPYTLQAIVYNSAGQVIGDYSRPVFVNNTLSWHEGILSGSQTWGTNAVNAVDENVIIPSGVTLTIAPGAIVKFTKGAGIIIEPGGTLDASEATLTEPTIFTSIADDSVGGDSNEEGDSLPPEVGDWNGITDSGQFKSSAYVEIRYVLQTENGTISASQEWFSSGEYLVTGNLTVLSNVTLTIDPGTIVKFDLGVNITVEAGGTLIAKGTVAQPIVFTSINDESVGVVTNAVPTIPAAGDWDSIYLNGGQAIFDHVTLSYGGGPDANNSGLISLIAAGSVLSVSDSILNQGFYKGIQSEYGIVNVTNCVVTGCQRGIQAGLEGPTVVNVVNCTVDNNLVGLIGHGGVLNVFNTIVSDSQTIGIQYCCGSTFVTLENCDVWSPTGSRYSGVNDQTGANGNISSNPNYVNAAQGNYELNYGSPCINAGNGSVAPLTDLLGAPCYNDPRTLVKTGTTNANGVYPDMGAYEFVENAPSDVDLIVTSVTGPLSLTAGQTVTVRWNDVNIGTANAIGPWHDTVSLVDQNGSATLAVATVLVAQDVVLGPGQSYPVSANVVVPGGQDGSYQWQVDVNSQGDVFEGANWTNNTALANAASTLSVPGLPSEGNLGTNALTAATQYAWYTFVAPSNGDFLVNLNRVGGTAGIDIFVGQGYVPTSQHYDAVFSGGASSTLSALISDTSSQPYYIAIYAQSAAGVGSFTVGTGAVSFALNSVTPTTVGNSGPATLTISGGQLTSQLTYQVVDPTGAAHTATSVTVANDTLVYATFDFTGLPLGAYSLQVDGGAAKLTDALTVSNTPAGNLVVTITGPALQRPGRSVLLAVDFTNAGGSDLPAPILFLSSDNGQFRLPGEPAWVPSEYDLMALSTNNGPVGVLPPGYQGEILVEFTQLTLSVGGTSHYYVSTVTNAGDLVEWSKLQTWLEPRFQPDEAWSAIYTNLVAKVGSSYGQLQSVLAQDATYLGQQGEWVANAQRLMAFEYEQADNFGNITQRYRSGAFGHFLNDPTAVTALPDANNNIVIQSSGTIRYFAVQPDGNYVAQPGDYGTLAKNGGVLQLTDKSGWISSFLSNGHISYWQDPNGNQITANYAGGLMTGLSDSSGDTVNFTYNAAGQITQVTDPVGRVSTYTYDASGQHLASATGMNGTTSYTWITNQGAATEHAISSIAFPDGSHCYYQYDGFGRMSSQSLDGGAQPISYSYGATGQITATNATGGSAVIQPNEFFQSAQVQDSIGLLFTAQYDTNHNLAEVKSSGGDESFLSYDSSGNLLQILDPLGEPLSFSYGSTSPGPVSLTDPLGHKIAAQYDDHGNLTGDTFPDGSSNGFQYDSSGHLIAWTNRRGHTTHYAYNSHNQITNTTLPDNSAQTFTYDSHRNLTSITDATGATTYNYDASDRMTNVTYPNGLFLRFAYGVGNLRTQVTDQTGFTVNYSYNALGQLVELSDVSSNLIVQYTYDAIGRLASKSFANGTVTTNSYTSTGLLQTVVNMGPNGSVASSFNYGYDPLGRVTSVTTLDGTFAYAYDANNQLVSVSLSSGRAIQYQYDGAGNRLSVVDGGTNSAYAVNALNEYSSASAASFSYDADGNVISKTDATGTTTYAYDDLNRLVSLTSPAGAWSYQYNALGQRTASTFNGQQTDYLVDPAGLGSVVGEYQTSGTLVAHYIFGMDLTSRVDSSGNSAYYAFDGSGNTVDLIDSAGAVQNSYSYLPFGEKLTATGSTSNLFTFVGSAGVMDDGDGFYFMRHRSYDPTVGHFTEPDPTGIAGGTLNLYEYANNNPVMETDPNGLGLLSYLWSLVPGSSTVNLANQAVQTANQATAAGQQRNDIYSAILNPSTTDQQLAGYSETSGGAVGGSIQPALTSTAGLTASGASYAYAVPFNTVANSPNPFSPLSIAPNAINNGLAAGSGGPNGPGGPSPSGPASIVPPPPGGYPPSGGGANGIPPGGSGPGGSGTGGPVPPPGPNNQPPPCPTCPPGPGPGPGGSIRYPGSADPNDKVTSGVGNQGYVADTGSIFYTVDFANETNASAPAAEVVVTDQLDTNLNWSTFEFESISFNNITIPVPDGVQSFVTTANVTTDPNPVQVTATFNPATGLITWVMESIDPVTGHLVTDPLAGFLPPDNAQEQGEGYLTYSVETKAGLATGTQIKNEATIVFDANAPIATPVTTNTVAATPPTSSMTALPATSPPMFTVSWSGQDVGPGIAGFNIFVSTNGGPWTPWILGTTNTSALFTGTAPNAYAFYSMAYDEVGNVQASPVNPGASTVVSSSAVTSVPISIARSGPGTVTLTWSQGTLLQATNVAGPWATNAATSPYVVAPTNSQMFFELLEN